MEVVPLLLELVEGRDQATHFIHRACRPCWVLLQTYKRVCRHSFQINLNELSPAAPKEAGLLVMPLSRRFERSGETAEIGSLP
jgi:hypothetical protein